MSPQSGNIRDAATFIFFGGIMSDGSTTKEGLLRQVDALRDIVRRSRRVAETMELESDRRILMAHVEQIEQCATRIEKQAIDAKTFAIGTGPLQKLKGTSTSGPSEA
jgi:hypothetical protein